LPSERSKTDEFIQNVNRLLPSGLSAETPPCDFLFGIMEILKGEKFDFGVAVSPRVCETHNGDLELYIPQFNEENKGSVWEDIGGDVEITIKGPLGPGLGIAINDSGLRVAFAENEGVMSVLDLVYFLYMKQLINTHYEDCEDHRDILSIPDQQRELIIGLNNFRLLLFVTFDTLESAFGLNLLLKAASECRESKRFILHITLRDPGDVNWKGNIGEFSSEYYKRYTPLFAKKFFVSGGSKYRTLVEDALVAYGIPLELVIQV